MSWRFLLNIFLFCNFLHLNLHNVQTLFRTGVAQEQRDSILKLNRKIVSWLIWAGWSSYKNFQLDCAHLRRNNPLRPKSPSPHLECCSVEYFIRLTGRLKRFRMPFGHGCWRSLNSCREKPTVILKDRDRQIIQSPSCLLCFSEDSAQDALQHSLLSVI